MFVKTRLLPNSETTITSLTPSRHAAPTAMHPLVGAGADGGPVRRPVLPPPRPRVNVVVNPTDGRGATHGCAALGGETGRAGDGGEEGEARERVRACVWAA